MKTIITSILILLSFVCFSQTNDLVVFSEQGDEFTLFINSVQQNESPQANVIVENISGESYSLRLDFVDLSIPVLTKNIWTESKNVEITVIAKVNKKGKYVLKYRGETAKIVDDSNADASYVNYEDPNADNSNNTSNATNTTTNTSSTTVTTERVPRENIDMPSETEVNMNVTSGDGDEIVAMEIQIDESGMSLQTGNGEETVSMDISINMENHPDAEVYESESYTTTTTTTYTTSSTTNVSTVDDFVENDNHDEIQFANSNSRCSFEMSPQEFLKAVSSVKSKDFEDDKLRVAKQVCENNCMTSEQIRDMNTIFTFESTKLEFAIFAYDFVYNSSDYYKVNDSFEFDMTIEELEEALEEK